MPRPSPSFLLLALLTLALPVATGAAETSAPAKAHIVTPDGAASATGQPLVLRGSPAARPAPTRAQGPASAADSGILVTAGDELWVLDPGRGTLSACELVGTTQVGRSRIECTTRPWRGSGATPSGKK